LFARFLHQVPGPLNEGHVIFQFPEFDGSVKKIRNIYFHSAVCVPWSTTWHAGKSAYISNKT